MKIVEDFPPNYEEIKAAFDIEGKPMVFTYGDTLYNPHKGHIPEHLLAHEEAHARQQTNPDEWWKRYLTDPAFRSEQELEAYAAQYKCAQGHIKDRNRLATFLFHIASDLASAAYGNIMTHGQAESRIRNLAKEL